MTPKKTSLIFSLLVILSLITGSSISLMQASAGTLEEAVTVAGLAGVGAAAEGYMFGPIWFPVYLANLFYFHNLLNYVESKSSAVGIAPESYAQALSDDWKRLADSYADTFTIFTGSANKYMTLYFVRVAEYSVLDYLGYSSLPWQSMRKVVHDMTPLLVWMHLRVKGLFNSLASDNEERLPEGYSFIISSTYPPGSTASGIEPITSDNIAIYYVLDEPATNDTVIWDLDELIRVQMPGATVLNLSRYFTTAPGHIEITFYDENAPGWFQGRYIILINANGDQVDHYDLQLLINKMDDLYNTLRQIYLTAKDYAEVYHEFLRSQGFTDKSQVPNLLICPPPDIVPYEIIYQGTSTETVAASGFEKLSKKDVALLYDAWWENAVKGLTASGEVESCVALVAEQVSEGNYTVTHTITTTTTSTRTTVVNATTTTITTVINGTTTTMVTTTGGTTVTETVTGTTTTEWVYRQGEAKIPDTFTRLYNVTICIPVNNGSSYDCYSVYEMAIISSLGDVVFEKGKTTILQYPLRAAIDYGDGYLRIRDFPAGTKITPQKIIRHTANGDVEVDRYEYVEKPLPDWLDLYGYSHPPQTVTVTQTGGDLYAAIGMLWSTMLVIFPMFIALIAVLAIPKILSDLAKIVSLKKVGK